MKRVIPGFGLSMGFTVAYLGLVILIPLAALFLKAAGLGWREWLEILGSPRVLAATRLTFGASFAAAVVSTVFGLLVSWVLVRYRVSRPSFFGFDGGPAVRPSHRGGWHHAHRDLCA